MSDLQTCEHCLKRVATLSGYRRTTAVTIDMIGDPATFKDCKIDTIVEWFYCSQECKDAHIKQTDSWTPDKQRASLSIFNDKTLDEWKKRHSL